MGYGVRKMTERVLRVFLLLRSTFPHPYLSIYGLIWGSKWPKMVTIFCFRIWNMGCLIEQAHARDHFPFASLTQTLKNEEPSRPTYFVPFYKWALEAKYKIKNFIIIVLIDERWTKRVKNVFWIKNTWIVGPI